MAWMQGIAGRAGKPRLFRHRFAGPLLASAMLAATLPLVGAAPASAVPAEAGYIGPTYDGVDGADDVNAYHSQRKLWFNQGRWYGLMMDKVDQDWSIFTLDMATQTWSDTDVPVDDRSRSHGDVLSVGNELFVVSAHSSDDQPVAFFSYTYNTSSDTYAPDAGPVDIPGSEGARYASVAQDSTGHLWSVWTRDSAVKYSTSDDSGTTWSAAADLPSQGGPLIAGPAGGKSSSDDIAGIVAFGSSIGVMWSNSSADDDAFYFAVHSDGAAVGTWTRETAFGGPGTSTADNHVSLVAAPDGRVLAAVKTSRDATGPESDPLVAVLERTTAGTWTEPRNVSNVDQATTRPIITLDVDAAEVNVFHVRRGTAVYRRTAPLATLDFGAPARGPIFIDSTQHLEINDPTSTSQPLTAESGTVVLATDIPTLTYLHGCAGAVCTPEPEPTGSRYVAVDPKRVMDFQEIGAQGTYTLTLDDVPAGATAVALNVTAANATGSSTFVSACPGGTPTADCKAQSNLNTYRDKNIANMVIVKLGGPGKNQVTFYNHLGTTDVIADLQGWFTSP